MDDLNLGMMDYGARFYDPSVGRWFTPDALAEKYYSDTTYGYGLENPVIYIDPDGNQVEMCCQGLYGFLAGMSDNLFGSNLRESLPTSDPVAFNNGLDAADTTSLIGGTLMMMDGGKNMGAGGAILTGSVVVTEGSGGLAIEVTAPAAAIGGLTILGGMAETAWGASIANNAKNNMSKRKGESSTSKSSTENKLEVEVSPENKIDRSKLNPPDKKGNAPTFKDDGTKVEIHHIDQNPNGPFKEMHWKDHRGKGNHKKNHPKGTGLTKEQRKEFDKARKAYWKKEF